MNIIIHTLIFFIEGAIALLLYRFHRLQSEPLKEVLKTENPDTKPSLVQVYSPDDDIETDIDIIAIHGLDAKSPGTWEYDTIGKPTINWLKDEAMLPSRIGNARIFTCDWPAKMFESPEYVELEIKELVRPLVARINERPQGNKRDRPILFIASCFGGVVLMNALLDASTDDNNPIISSTRGIIFLATPFNGTAFGRIAYWARPALSFIAWLVGSRLNSIYQYVEGGNWEIFDITQEFDKLRTKHGYSVFGFYETDTINLLAKKLPWISAWLTKRELVGYPGSILCSS